MVLSSPTTLTGALVALVGASALPLSNYLANHRARVHCLPGEGTQEAARRALLYPLAVVLFAGALVPVLAVRWLTRDGWIRNDLPVNGGDTALLGISLVVGFCPIALALRGQLRREFWHSLRLFIALFAVSLAEVLVFLSIVFNLTEVVTGSLLHPPWATAAAAIVSSVLFGLYHFTHSPPWNNWAQATLLFVVWLFVSLAYVLTRDVWVAAIIDTSFATIGFIRNSVTTLDDVPIMRAVALDALSIGVIAAVL